MEALRRLDPWLPPLLLMAVIFGASAQPSLDSGLGVIDLVGRKLVHFGEYALLCVLWWRALVTRTSPGRATMSAFLIAALYAATDEFHQSFVDGRSATVVDWAIDVSGATVAALVLRRRARRRRAV